MRIEHIKNDEDYIINHLETLPNSELVDYFNRMCEYKHWNERMIRENGEDFFNEEYDGEILKAVRAVSEGNYSYSHKYLIINGQANIESFDDPADYIDFIELANFMADTPGKYPEIILCDEDQWAELFTND